jgi:shikimate dehydrogenase
LIQAGFQNIALFNRHLHRGERLVKHFGRSAAHMDLKARPWHDSVIEAELAKTDILINASGVGADPDETPIPGELLPPDILVMDLHYVPEETRLLREAREAGATKVMNGDFMLIEQTAAAFRLWTGEEPPIDVMRETLKAARNKPEEPVPSAEEQAAEASA